MYRYGRMDVNLLIVKNIWTNKSSTDIYNYLKPDEYSQYVYKIQT